MASAFCVCFFSGVCGGIVRAHCAWFSEDPSVGECSLHVFARAAFKRPDGSCFGRDGLGERSLARTALIGERLLLMFVCELSESPVFRKAVSGENFRTSGRYRAAL